MPYLNVHIVSWWSSRHPVQLALIFSKEFRKVGVLKLISCCLLRKHLWNQLRTFLKTNNEESKNIDLESRPKCIWPKCNVFPDWSRPCNKTAAHTCAHTHVHAHTHTRWIFLGCSSQSWKETTGSCSKVKTDMCVQQLQHGPVPPLLSTGWHCQQPSTLACCKDELLAWASEVNRPEATGTYGIRLSFPPDLTPSRFWT